MLEVSETREPGVVVVGLAGRLDGTTAADLDARLGQLVAAGERQVVLDLARLEYITSVGLRTILVVAKQLRAGAGKLVIAALQDPVKQVFDLAGFSALLPICSTRREAVATAQG